MNYLCIFCCILFVYLFFRWWKSIINISWFCLWDLAPVYANKFRDKQTFSTLRGLRFFATSCGRGSHWQNFTYLLKRLDKWTTHFMAHDLKILQWLPRSFPPIDHAELLPRQVPSNGYPGKRGHWISVKYV